MQYINVPALSSKAIMDMDYFAFEEYIRTHFVICLPASIDTPEDLEVANQLSLRYVAYRSYFMEMQTIIDNHRRLLKRHPDADRSVIDDLMCKSMLLEAYSTKSKEARDVIWQAVKTRQGRNEELRLLSET